MLFSVMECADVITPIDIIHFLIAVQSFYVGSMASVWVRNDVSEHSG